MSKAKTKIEIKYECQWECSICFTNDHYPMCINPCGHSFCESCMKKIYYYLFPNCPECSVKIIDKIPNYALGKLLNKEYKAPHPNKVIVAVNKYNTRSFKIIGLYILGLIFINWLIWHSLLIHPSKIINENCTVSNCNSTLIRNIQNKKKSIDHYVTEYNYSFKNVTKYGKINHYGNSSYCNTIHKIDCWYEKNNIDTLTNKKYLITAFAGLILYIVIHVMYGAFFVLLNLCFSE